MPSTERHEWRHESEQAHRHRWYPRPPQEREIVRRKSFTLHRCTVDEAATRLNLLDLPFLFFRDADSSRCAVLYHRYDGHYGLITAADEPDNRRPGQVAQS